MVCKEVDTEPSAWRRGPGDGDTYNEILLAQTGHFPLDKAEDPAAVIASRDSVRELLGRVRQEYEEQPAAT